MRVNASWTRLAIILVGLGSLGLGAACSSGSPSTDGPSTSSSHALSRAFEATARTHGVPRDLMVAIAATEHGLGVAAKREVEAEVEIPSAGPMQLRHGHLDTLARAAALLHTTELALRQDADLALDGGAAVLAELASTTGAREDDLATWQSAIEEMSGYSDELRRHEYAHRVFALLARGGHFEGRDGETIALGAHDLPPTLTLDISSTLRAAATQPEFPGAEWIPTSCVNKCNTTRAGASVTHIVIHDTECGWDVAVATLQNDPGKSVQYIVGTDGRTAQFVPESYTAWHSGNAYYNARSVGIEHVGYAAKPFTDKQYAASAELVKYLRAKYTVAADRAHIIGHDQVPDGPVIGETSAPCALSPKACTTSGHYGGANNHGDPGIWEWATYMPRIGGEAKCSDVTSVLNCSYDDTRAFHCVNDKVEVLECTACTVMPTGQADECTVKPAAAPPEPTPSATGEAPKPPPGAPATPVVDDGPVPQGGDDGCSIASRAPLAGHANTGLLLVGLGIVAGALRRTRRRA
jgi:N-acetyl-anhydromuramyl-L-alanine amidase AmpD